MLIVIGGGGGFLDGGEAGGGGEVAGGRGGRAGEALDEGHELVDGGVDDFGRDGVDDDGLVVLRRRKGVVLGKWVVAEEAGVRRWLLDLDGVFAEFERGGAGALELELLFGGGGPRRRWVHCGGGGGDLVVGCVKGMGENWV